MKKDADEVISVSGSECLNVTVEPSTDVNAETTAENVIVAEEVSDDFLDQFSDMPLEENPEKATAKIGGLINFLKSSKFKHRINVEAYKRGVPPRQLAQGFISRAIGTLGDTLGIAIGTIQATLNGLLDLLHTILKSGVNIIMSAVRGLAKIITFNQTAVA